MRIRCWLNGRERLTAPERLEINIDRRDQTMTTNTSMTAKAPSEISQIDRLAAEAQMYAMNARLNLFNLARVFSEAKKILPHGEWGKWVEQNAGVEMRTAQQMIQTYERFGGMPEMATLDRTKLYKMTALPEGTEEAFMGMHDVNAMSSREVEKAVKDYKAQLEAENEQKLRDMEAKHRMDMANMLSQEREARAKLESDLAEAKKQQKHDESDALAAEIEARTKEITALEEEIERLKEAGKESMEQARTATAENARLKREIEDNEDALAEQQAEITRVQTELLNLQSAQARGEGAREATDSMTADDFAAAVRQFIGTCARVPYMGSTFWGMDESERTLFSQNIAAVEGWCRQARQALESVMTEGVIDHE